VNGSSAEIYEAVQEHMEACRAALKDRFVDTRQLTNIGPYIDWRALLHG